MSTGSRTQTTRVALVDGYATGHQLVPAMNQHGAECVHVRSLHPDVHTVKAKFPDGYLDDIRFEGDIAATAAALRKWDVSCVVAGGESGVELADRLSAELGTPGNGMTRPDSRRNKYEMVLAMRDAGMVHANTIVSSDADEIVAWAEQTAGYPVVLKPVSSAGRDNVVACSTAEQVRAVHRQIMSSTDRVAKPNTVVLAQEFLDGTEYFINAVSRDGKHHTVEIWRYHKTKIAGGHTLHAHTDAVSPDDPNVVALERYGHQVLDALEIRNGASHIEIMMTADGPVLVECAARIGGGSVPEILERALESHQLDLLGMSVGNPDEFNRLPTSVYRLLRHIRFVNLINLTDGGVSPSPEKMAAVRALPSCAHAVLLHPEGQALVRTVDFATQPGFVFLIADELDELEADYEKLRELERDYLYVDDRP